jgi:hypothetical protein
MIRTGIGLAILGLALVPAQVLADDDSPAEAVRKALDKEITLDFVGQTIEEAVQHLREKTKLNFVVDSNPMQFFGNPFGGVPDPNQNPPQATLRITKGKVRLGLKRMLEPFDLTYVIIGDTVVISTEEQGLKRQMKQRVQIDVDKVPLDAALKKLGKTYAINMVIDPEVAKDAQAPVTLQLEDVTLENSVRLLTEIGGLKSVRLGNVLFITNESKADKLRKEDKANPPTNPYGVPFIGGGIGGFGGGIRVAPAPLPANPPPKALPPKVAPNPPVAPPVNNRPANNVQPAPAPVVPNAIPARPPQAIPDPSR